MKSIVLILASLPGAALAQGGSVVHAHPHGAEGLIAGLAVIAIAAGLAWIRR